MSSWSNCSSGGLSLCGTEGELVSVRVSVTPRLLEELLEALAEISFPINPQVRHNGASQATLVEFPAYAGRLQEVKDVLRRAGFDARAVEVTSMLEEIRYQPAVSG